MKGWVRCTQADFVIQQLVGLKLEVKDLMGGSATE
jgi:hypothetical protein